MTNFKIELNKEDIEWLKHGEATSVEEVVEKILSQVKKQKGGEIK